MAGLEEIARKLFLEQCQPGDRGALERHGEKAAVAAIIAALSMDRQFLADALADELGDSYDCTRVWSAWSYGTMGADDFVPVNDRASEIAGGIVDMRVASLLNRINGEA